MKLRQFNDSGITWFREILQTCRNNPSAIIDRQPLEDDTLTQKIPGSVDVTSQNFKTRGDAGQYLHSLLDPVCSHDDLMTNTGLWSWLSLLFFDSVCPLREDKGRKVRSDYYYIFNREKRDFYRHFLFVSWRVLDITNNHHRLITSKRIDSIDEVTDRIMGDLTLIRIPCIFEVLDSIYWDEKTQTVRKNIVGRTTRKGDISNRFPRVIQQLEKTYDLQSLDAVQLRKLLGNEFDFSSR